MRRGLSFRRGTALRLRRRWAASGIIARMRAMLYGSTRQKGSERGQREIIPRMTAREIKALTKELLKSLERQGGK